MPQPLSKVRRKAEIVLGASALIARPDFASQVMRVIAAWSLIDSTLASLLINLLKADTSAGAAIYGALNGSEAKRAVLLAAVDTNHPEWQRLLLRAVLKAVKPSRDQRNDFAHNVYASSPQLPDAVLLIPQQAHSEREVKRRKAEDIHASGKRVAPEDANPPFERSQVQVWREGDFKDAVDRAIHAWHLVQSLAFTIGEHRHESVRRELLSEPLVQQALQPLTLGCSPEVQAQLSPPGDDPPAPGIWESWDRVLGRIP
jgi:hypothetical protein